MLVNRYRCLLKFSDINKGGFWERYRSTIVQVASITMSPCKYHALEILANMIQELDYLIEKAKMVLSRVLIDMRR